MKRCQDGKGRDYKCAGSKNHLAIGITENRKLSFNRRFLAELCVRFKSESANIIKNEPRAWSIEPDWRRHHMREVRTSPVTQCSGRMGANIPHRKLMKTSVVNYTRYAIIPALL